MNEDIKILVVDNEDEFFEFVKNCISAEALSSYEVDCECVKTDHAKQNEELSLDYDIYILVEQNNQSKSEDKVSRIAGKIRKEKGPNPHIFIVTNSSNPVFLKKLIETNITGLINKEQRDCSTLEKSIEKALQTRTAICHISELKTKIEKI